MWCSEPSCLLSSRIRHWHFSLYQIYWFQHFLSHQSHVWSNWIIMWNSGWLLLMHPILAPTLYQVWELIFWKVISLVESHSPTTTCVDMTTFVTNLHYNSFFYQLCLSVPGLFSWCLCIFVVLKCHVLPWCMPIEIRLHIIYVLYSLRCK
jgi:hypothetical protein